MKSLKELELCTTFDAKRKQFIKCLNESKIIQAHGNLVECLPEDAKEYFTTFKIVQDETYKEHRHYVENFKVFESKLGFIGVYMISTIKTDNNLIDFEYQLNFYEVKRKIKAVYEIVLKDVYFNANS